MSLSRAAACAGLMLVAGCSALPPLPDFGGFGRAPAPVAQQGLPAASTTAVAAEPGVIEVVNASAGSLDMVFISGCGVPSDGSNRLAPGSRIPPGGRRQFSVAPGCWTVDAGIAGVGQARQQLDVQRAAISRYTVTG